MNKIKSSRALSFAAIALVYMLAAAVGIGAYMLLSAHIILRLFIADAAATLIVFIFSLIFKNASVYDPYWSVQPAVIITAFTIKYGVNSLGIFLLIAIWFWALRLTANWAYTFKNLNSQDWRYTMLSEKTGKFYPLVNLVGIHLVPTIVVYFCTIPAVLAITNNASANPLSLIFCILSVIAAAVQGIADIQMHKYRSEKKTPFIRFGLWKYSRHPNYLCEILHWWFIALAVFSSLTSPIMLLGALQNTFLFLAVSIPMADERQSKKDGWQTYKAQTHALLPIYKRQPVKTKDNRK